jgi:16S rRNA G966 N2-methylase RsmD
MKTIGVQREKNAMLDEHRCDACRHRKCDLKNATNDAHHTKRDHRPHRQSSNHKRRTNEANNFEVFHDPPYRLAEVTKKLFCLWVTNSAARHSETEDLT